MTSVIFEMLYRLSRFGQSRHFRCIKRRRSTYQPQQLASYNRFWEQSLAGGWNVLLEYGLPYPRIDFLNYLCDERGMVAHGSSVNDLQVIKPIRLSTDASEFGNRRQIFCSLDAAWAIWFAILDKSKVRTTRNGCVRLGARQGKWIKFYHFELEHRFSKRNDQFTSGTVYLFHESEFPFRHRIPLMDIFRAEFEERGSSQPVAPLARLTVAPEDFPYLDRVIYCI